MADNMDISYFDSALDNYSGNENTQPEFFMNNEEGYIPMVPADGLATQVLPPHSWSSDSWSSSSTFSGISPPSDSRPTSSSTDSMTLPLDSPAFQSLPLNNWAPTVLPLSSSPIQSSYTESMSLPLDSSTYQSLPHPSWSSNSTHEGNLPSGGFLPQDPKPDFTQPTTAVLPIKKSQLQPNRVGVRISRDSCERCRVNKKKCEPSSAGSEICKGCTKSGTNCVRRNMDKRRKNIVLEDIQTRKREYHEAFRKATQAVYAMSCQAGESLSLSPTFCNLVEELRRCQDQSNEHLIRQMPGIVDSYLVGGKHEPQIPVEVDAQHPTVPNETSLTKPQLKIARDRFVLAAEKRIAQLLKAMHAFAHRENGSSSMMQMVQEGRYEDLMTLMSKT